jgi:DNA-binding transcriptional LysR family regulator
VRPLPAERSLPLRTPIRGGESLDSWVEDLARRTGMSARRLLYAFGMRPRDLPGHRFHALVLGLPPPILRRIERQAGLPEGRLDAAVADRYARLGWEVLHGCRYCPCCLSDHNGQWQLRWRLPWVFACTRHRLLMPDRCPGCGQMPRRHLSEGTGLNPPASCPNPAGRGRVCGTDLTGTPFHTLAVRDPRLVAQRWLDNRLTYLEAGDPDALVDLADLQAVVTWIRSRTTVGYFTDDGPAAVAAFTAYITRRADRRRPEQHLFTDPLLVAPVVTRAVALIRIATPTTILPLLAPLLGQAGHVGVNARGRLQAMTVSLSRWRTLSPRLRQRLLSAIDTRLAPLDRLRFRTATTRPRLPEQAGTTAFDRVRERFRWVPQLLWPDWTVRLLPPRGVYPDTLRATLAAALLVPGRPDRVLTRIAADLHPPAHFSATLTSTLRRLTQHGSSEVLEMICRLADHLDTDGAPIDYQRRRALIGIDLLDRDQWWQVCFDAHAHPGEDRRHLDARRYVYQLLTGVDLTSPAAGPLQLPTPNDRNIYLAFANTLTTPLRERLHEYATERLRALGIREPVTWSPPGHLADGLILPGRDPNDIDLDTVRTMILDQRQPFQTVADALGTTIEHIRLATERVYRPPRQWGRNAAPTYWRTQQRAQQLLTAEFFDREYVKAGKTLAQIADQTGLHRTMLAQYARAAGIRLVNATQRQPTPIDPHWLREQYLTHGRSFTDIAADLGLSEMTVNRAAHRFGIPIRPAGVTSHPQMIARLDHTIPPDVRVAVEGVRHGWLRLHRFQQAMAYPSLNAAASHTGVHLSALVTQLQRLEADIGAQLFHRGTPSQPTRLTERGAALLDALSQRHIQTLLHEQAKPPPGWKPDDRRRPAARATAAPTRAHVASRIPDHDQTRSTRTPDRPVEPAQQLPQILRRATQHRGGWARLRRFATAMNHPTLTEAAYALGINASTLIEQLGRLEHDIGQPLFHRATPDGRTQRPTRVGTDLMNASTAYRRRVPGDQTAPLETADIAAMLPSGLPRDLLRAVRGQRSGWTRLHRFAVTMTHPSVTDAATALSIERTTLLEQLQRLETHVGTTLYHRATAQGQAHRPTRRGARLLSTFARPDVQALCAARTRLPRLPDEPRA